MDGAVRLGRKVGDARGRDGSVGAHDERNDIADFGFDAGAIAVFFDSGAVIDGGSALEITEGFADGFVATTENPVDNFAFVHSIEVVEGEIITKLHGADDVGDELEGGAGFVAAVFGKEREGRFDKILTDAFGAEAEFVDVVFVLEDSNVVIESFNFIESPGVVEEVAVG